MTKRLSATAGGRTSSRMVWSTLDQGFSSASNFVLVFLLARNSSASEFGLLMIGYLIITVAVGVSRNAFGGILGMDLPAKGADGFPELVARSVAATVATAFVVAAALAAYATVVPRTEDGRSALLVLALALPLVLWQDLQRFWAVAIGQPHHAALSDLVWLATAGFGFALPFVLDVSPSATAGAVFWALGAVLGWLLMLVLGYHQLPRFRGLIPWLRGDRRRFYLGSDALLSVGSPLVNSAAIAALGGPQVVAAIRGAGTLFGPLNLLSATFPLALVPEAIRSGPSRAKRMYVLAGSGFAVLAVGWGLVLHVLPQSIGSQLLGESWSLVQLIVLVTATEYVGLGVWAVARARFRVQNRLALALRLRVAFSVTTLVAPILAVAVWGTARSAAVALAATSLCFAAVALWASREPRETEAELSPTQPQ